MLPRPLVRIMGRTLGAPQCIACWATSSGTSTSGDGATYSLNCWPLDDATATSGQSSFLWGEGGKADEEGAENQAPAFTPRRSQGWGEAHDRGSLFDHPKHTALLGSTTELRRRANDLEA